MKRRYSIGLIALLGWGSLTLVACDKKPEATVESQPAEEPAPPEPTAPVEPTAPPSEETSPTTSVSGSRFNQMDDGSPVPALANDAPTKVKLGVVLFAYEGAQGVPGQLRSREKALELAKAALQAGNGKFADVLSKGDPGSKDDIGWIRRGVLEKRVEYEVFRLAKGAISPEPVDTPRGFWIVQRTQ